MNGNGVWWEDDSHMGNAAIDYFNEIFSSNPCIEMDETIHVVESVVNEDRSCQTSSSCPLSLRLRSGKLLSK